MKREPSKWARWEWPSGLGRWHAILSTEGAVTMLACGRKRQPPKVTAGRPGAEKCCPTCARFDDLRTAYGSDKADQPATASPVTVEPVKVPELAVVGTSHAADLPCACRNCGGKAERERLIAERHATFEAYLAGRTGAH